MKIALKTILAFLSAALAPVVVFFIIVLILAFVSPKDQLAPSSLLAGKIELWQVLFGAASTVFWMVFFVILVGGMIFAITSGHVIVLGIPAFLIGLRLKAIRLWSTLIVSFLIGAIPTAMYALVQGWSDLIRYPNYYPTTDLPTSVGMSIIVMTFIGGLGGLFGLSGGLAFWLVWRFLPGFPSKPEPKPEPA